MMSGAKYGHLGTPPGDRIEGITTRKATHRDSIIAPGGGATYELVRS